MTKLRLLVITTAVLFLAGQVCHGEFATPLDDRSDNNLDRSSANEGPVAAVREKRAPLHKLALLGGAALVGKKALLLGGTALGAKAVLGAGALGIGALGVGAGLYKAKQYAGGFGYGPSHGGYQGGYYEQPSYSSYPSLHQHYHDHHHEHYEPHLDYHHYYDYGHATGYDGWY